jgi:hypothetical protein
MQTSSSTSGGLITATIEGTLIHVNTIEEFRDIDVTLIITNEKKKFKEGQANRFVLLVFGDLKTYDFSYRFALLRHNSGSIMTKSAKLASNHLKKE